MNTEDLESFMKKDPNLSAYPFQPLGWVCPLCGFVNGPHTPICANSYFAQYGTSGTWRHT